MRLDTVELLLKNIGAVKNDIGLITKSNQINQISASDKKETQIH
jgi:hypothetical protein